MDSDNVMRMKSGERSGTGLVERLNALYIDFIRPVPTTMFEINRLSVLFSLLD